MKVFIFVSVYVAIASAYPTKHGFPGKNREKKSTGYGVPSGGGSLYGPAPAAPAPCASASMPAQASPVAFYLAPAGHLPSPALHYRFGNENDGEVMEFEERDASSALNHLDHSQARSYGAYGPGAGGLEVLPVQAASAGPAIGLFPKANIGGCAIPLLLSCAPSVTSGKLLPQKTQQPTYAAAAPAYSYRSNLEFEGKTDMNNENMDKHIQKAAQWNEMERKSPIPESNHFHLLSTDAHLSPSGKVHDMTTSVFPLPGPAINH